MGTAIYSNFWRRACAYLIDTLIIYYICISLSISIGIETSKLNTQGQGANLILYILLLIITIGYFVLFWTKYEGQTIGNRIMAIKVIKENGKELDLSTSIVRYFGYIIAWLPLGLGFLWIILDSKKQGWHDKIARTVVVKTNEKPKTKIAASIIGCSCLIYIVIIIFVSYLIYVATKNPQSLSREVRKMPLLEEMLKNQNQLNQRDTYLLANNVFVKAVEFRKKNNLNEWVKDPRLCAYAQRRLQQLSKTGKYDDGKGFYEDLANQTINNAYFKDYNSIGESTYNIDVFSRAEDVINFWAKGKDTILRNSKYTNACIRADKNFLILIAGERNSST